MPAVTPAETVRDLLLRLAERVKSQSGWSDWHIEEVPASRVHDREVLLVFTSPRDRTVEELVVRAQRREDAGWVVDATDREGVLLDGTRPWDATEPEALSGDALVAGLSALEGPIVTALADVPRL